MYSDEDVIDRLRESFNRTTRPLSPDPALARVVRERLRRRRIARLGFASAATLSATALVTGAVVAESHSENPHVMASIPSHAPVIATSAPTVHAPVLLASLSEVLDAAAQARNPVAGPGQYLHTQVTSYVMSELIGRRVIAMFSTNGADYWAPASASAPSLTRSAMYETVTFSTAADRTYIAQHAPGGVPTPDLEWTATQPDGSVFQIYPTFAPQAAVKTLGPEPTEQIWTEPAAQAQLPRDPVALRASLYRYADAQAAEAAKVGKGYGADDAAFDALAAALSWPTATADLREALFEVVKTIPGIAFKGSMANYAGTLGIGIGRVWQATGIEHDLIFDAGSGQFIGDRSVTVRTTDQYPGVEGQPTLAAGTLISATAYSVDITAEPALPAGTRLP